MNKEQLIKVGYLARPHGIKGEVELRSLGPDQGILKEGIKVWLFPASEKSNIPPQGELSLITKIRGTNKMVATFEGVSDRTYLESLLPCEIYLHRSDFPSLGEGEIYLVDLLEMVVIDEEGRVMGRVDGLTHNNAQVLVEVRMNDNDQQITLPYVKNFFPHVDLKTKQLTLIFPEYTE